ncbi:MAG TPA: hypothetical protein DEF45_05325, partial [Rhodopirellula sp.]|nr:hypothetical protein [Rhodopirellula sp.]
MRDWERIHQSNRNMEMLQFGYRVLLALFVSLGVICVPASAQKSDAGRKTPNIVLIMADDLG